MIVFTIPAMVAALLAAAISFGCSVVFEGPHELPFYLMSFGFPLTLFGGLATLGGAKANFFWVLPAWLVGVMMVAAGTVMGDAGWLMWAVAGVVALFVVVLALSFWGDAKTKKEGAARLERAQGLLAEGKRAEAMKLGKKALYLLVNVDVATARTNAAALAWLGDNELVHDPSEAKALASYYFSVAENGVDGIISEEVSSRVARLVDYRP